MKVFTHSQVHPNLQKEEVKIRREVGTRSKPEEVHSPFDVPGVNSTATTADILDAVRESRER